MRTGAGGPAPREMRVTDRLVLGWLSAYLSGATFILQGMCGLSPQAYSYAFGLNSLGFRGLRVPRSSCLGTLVGAGHLDGRQGLVHGRHCPHQPLHAA